MKLTLVVLEEIFAIHRLAVDAIVPVAVFSAEFYSITRSAEELSIVVPETIALESDHVSSNWRALQVLGPLDFALTGILARLATTLADANISIFAISTYDTDYILVKQVSLSAAITVLRNNGYGIVE
jgi:hypothetical protein